MSVLVNICWHWHLKMSTLTPTPQPWFQHQFWFSSVQSILTNGFGIRPVSAMFVPKLLSADQKDNRLLASQDLIHCRKWWLSEWWIRILPWCVEIFARCYSSKNARDACICRVATHAMIMCLSTQPILCSSFWPSTSFHRSDSHHILQISRAPCDFFLFSKIKSHLKGRIFWEGHRGHPEECDEEAVRHPRNNRNASTNGNDAGWSV